MKKRILAMLAMLLCCMVLAACGTAANEAETNTITTAAATTIAATTTGSESKLFAEVANISGNELTLKVLSGSFDPEQIAQRMGGGNGMGRPGGGNRPEGGGFGEDFTFPEGMSRPEPGNRPEGGPPPEGFSMPEGFTMPEGIPPMNEGGRPAPGAFPSTYTGEEKEVTIPDDVPVVSIAFSDGVPQTSEASITDIKNGDTVQVVYDGEHITEVQIINMDAPGMP